MQKLALHYSAFRPSESSLSQLKCSLVEVMFGSGVGLTLNVSAPVSSVSFSTGLVFLNTSDSTRWHWQNKLFSSCCNTSIVELIQKIHGSKLYIPLLKSNRFYSLFAIYRAQVCKISNMGNGDICSLGKYIYVCMRADAQQHEQTCLARRTKTSKLPLSLSLSLSLPFSSIKLGQALNTPSRPLLIQL